MWIAEKFQSNPEIAGSPRNSFRASLIWEVYGGRALDSLGGVKACRRIPNRECRKTNIWESGHTRQVGWPRGKEPRPTAKVPECMLSGKGCGISETARTLAQKQPYVKRVRNSSLAERSRAEDVRG